MSCVVCGSGSRYVSNGKCHSCGHPVAAPVPVSYLFGAGAL